MRAGPVRREIFICYRRNDTGAYAGRLNDALSNEFGEDNVFFDRGGAIDGGDDWKKVIDERLESCAALLVLIGINWQTARLADPEDLVRREISSALARGVRVIPILVNDASLPSAADLPEEIRPVLDRQIMEMTDRHWRTDYERLAKSIRREIARRRRTMFTLLTSRSSLAVLAVVLVLGLFLATQKWKTVDPSTGTDTTTSSTVTTVQNGTADDSPVQDASTDAQPPPEADTTNSETSTGRTESMPISNQYYRLQLKHTKQFLDASYCTNDLNLQAGSDFDGGSCELFRFVANGDGWSRLQLMATGKYLDACAAEVRLDEGKSGDYSSCQLWRLVPAGEGWSRLQLKRDGQYLEAERCSTKIALGPISDSEDGACQLWRIVAPPANAP